jgi:hypothetical protein
MDPGSYPHTGEGLGGVEVFGDPAQQPAALYDPFDP